MLTFLFIMLFIIVFGALVAGVLTFLPSGTLQKMEDSAKTRSEKRE